MSTQVSTTTTPAIIVKADAAVIKSIASFLSLEAKAEAAVAASEGGYIGIAKATLPVVARQGYTDKGQVSQLLLLSFLSQAGVAELDDNDPKKVEVMDRHKSNISNLTSIIMPKTPELATARDTAFAYNDRLPKDCRPNLRIGQKHILAIVRGNSTVDDVIAVKEGRTPSAPTAANPSAASVGVNATATPEKGTGDVSTQPAPGTVPQPEASNTTGVITATPADAFRHVLRTMLPNYVNNLGMSKDDVKAVLTEELERFMAA